ncbi:MAG: substrate-binding domain-containing protein [Christensenellales bacterium]|jgi:LacI family transcriptional regulator
MRNTITMKQIAKLAGVHRSTVDKVIHNRKGVSDSVRRNVQRIIDSVGYKPNVIGKALKQQDKKLRIAVILVCVYSTSAVLEGIKIAYNEFSRFGMDIEYYFISYGDIDEQVRAIDMLSDKGVDGVVILSFNSEKIINSVNRMVDKGIPVVTVNTDLMPSNRMCYVGQNHSNAGRTAARLAKEMLHGKGRMAIVCGSHQYISATKERYTEFQKHIKEISTDIEIVEVVNTVESDQRMFEVVFDLLKRVDIDYIYATAGGIRGAGKAIKMLNKADKVKMICHDIFPEVLELIREGIVSCTISQDNVEQGYRSVKILFEYLFYGEKPKKDYMHTAIDIRMVENMPDDESEIPPPILDPAGLRQWSGRLEMTGTG